VLDAARELGYVPSSHARSLTTGRTGAVGVLVPDITNPYYFELIRGTQHQLSALGILQLLVDTEESVSHEAAHLASLRKSVDGVILAASRLGDDQLAEAAAQLPLVAINRDVPGVPAVLIDTPGGMRLAVEHLASLGHRRLAFAAGLSAWQSRQRWDAIEDHCRGRGIEVQQLGPFAPTREAGAGAAAAVLNAGVTACIAYNDLLAIGMLEHLHARGVDVPRSLSVVGCDDIFGSSFCPPPLTTLTSPTEQAGRVAVKMLAELLAPSDAEVHAKRELLSTHLTVRSSTGEVPLVTHGRS
jgi:LacI family transcriptional regulator